eukprot:CAMPEP_0177640594 /NCGR_PEP_ID=MMETSP0447-20121125/6625_1 /TAXON_ID=0 /ORGANISM="Stygamoeba regulata, Strain BSH-02190019" /LENGTH=104 /DNA_ID=CAMNT_0019142673 /DNA_START=179 /DNA_END=493 /DNA_ORIENTATION=+
MGCCCSMCVSPKFPENADYIGTWTGGGIKLTISDDCYFTYSTKTTLRSISINEAPITKWYDDDSGFDVFVGLCSKKMHVQSPPKKDDSGKWTMVVNGDELTRDA